MDRSTATISNERALVAFAHALQEEIGAEHVLLFGSQAHGQGRADSDYDVIVVSRQFENIEQSRRATGLRQQWYAVGGVGPMDLICLTPEEFEAAQHRISLVAEVLPEAVELLAEPVS